ncbi:NmrA/HSCARG family protein [Halomonas sp. HP20-15]|uniref:NmrA/HSCARG family protein n=1 Tax=Halomonas sp. HP20-15 TaxID=3085901 RepID=UPI00298156E9|nr:NmrA/HSCARG family protein [Halomonas sp. HP20-15]MDW5377209.1 NmrA/HSCARG family protein [Halomonas sp. HP20-15]
MSDRKQTIAVVGASGQQGQGVVEALKADGAFRVRALTRNPERYRGPADEAIYADLDRPESLNEAFRDAYGVFAMTNAWQPGTDEIAQGRAMVAAAKAQNAEHFVWSTLPDVEKLSGGRFDVPHFTNKARVNEYVATAGFRYYSYVMPAFYYQNFAQNLAVRPQPDGSLGWSLPIGPDVAIDMADIGELGKLVAAVFRHPQETGQGLYLPHVGSQISFNDIIGGFERQGIELTFSQVPAEPFAKAVPGGHELAQMFAWFEAYGYFGGDFTQERQLATRLVGQAPTGFFEWAKNSLRLERESDEES